MHVLFVFVCLSVCFELMIKGRSLYWCRIVLMCVLYIVFTGGGDRKAFVYMEIAVLGNCNVVLYLVEEIDI